MYIFNLFQRPTVTITQARVFPGRRMGQLKALTLVPLVIAKTSLN